MELLFAIAAVAAGVAAVARHSIVARRERAARSAARTTIANAPEGRRARVVGTILDGNEVFLAPITGRRCVYCAYTIEEYIGSSVLTWRKLEADIRGVPFTITDGSGRALVDADGAEVEIDPKGGLRSGAVEPSMDVMRRVAHLLRPSSFTNRVRYREAALSVGDTVAVVGVAVREPDPDAIADVSGYREGPPTRLRLGSAPSQRLFISDTAAEVEVD